MDRILNGIGIAVLLLLMAAGVFIYVAPHFGWQVEAVRSGSMAPEIERGTLVVAQRVNPEMIAVNDIIIFRPVGVGENNICHRVIVVENSPLQFRTKGDAEKNPDPFVVPARNLVGRVFYHLRWIGYAVLFIKTPVGFLLTVVVPGLVIIGICLKSIWLELLGKSKGKKTAA